MVGLIHFRADFVLRSLEGVLGVELVESLLFGSVEFWGFRGECLGSARVPAGQFHQPLCGKIPRCGQQLVLHLRVGAVEVERVAGVGNEHGLTLEAARPEYFSGDEIGEFFGLDVPEGELLAL